MKEINLEHASTVIPLSDGSLVALISREKCKDEKEKCRNVYKVNVDGVVLWQVGDYPVMPALSSFTHIEVHGHDLFAYNFDGGMYRIAMENGAIISSELVK